MDAAVQIFASPPEPLFNLRGQHLADILVDDVFSTLMKQSRVQTCNKKQAPIHFNHGEIAACVLSICDYFQQQHETRYLAIQLVEKFLDTKCRQRFKTLASSQLKNRQKLLEWKKFSSSLKRQSFLYILTCVQLSSKMCSHSKVMSISRSLRFLRGSSEVLTAGNMMVLELEVLQTINYEFPITSPLTYLEAMLEILGSEKDLLGSVKLLHHICLRVLDLAYLKRRVIYDKLFRFAIKGRCSTSRRSEFVVVENDDFLLAASIIEAAAYLSNKEKETQVLTHLSEVTQIPEEDILDLATVLVETFSS